VNFLRTKSVVNIDYSSSTIFSTLLIQGFSGKGKFKRDNGGGLTRPYHRARSARGVITVTLNYLIVRRNRGEFAGTAGER